MVARHDVYDAKPLLPIDSLLNASTALLAPHLGYVTAWTMQTGYADAVDSIAAWQRGAPVRVLAAG